MRNLPVFFWKAHFLLAAKDLWKAFSVETHTLTLIDFRCRFSFNRRKKLRIFPFKISTLRCEYSKQYTKNLVCLHFVLFLHTLNCYTFEVVGFLAGLTKFKTKFSKIFKRLHDLIKNRKIMPYSQENRIHTRANVYGGQAYNAFCSSHRVDYMCIGALCLCILHNFSEKRATDWLNALDGERRRWWLECLMYSVWTWVVCTKWNVKLNTHSR